MLDLQLLLSAISVLKQAKDLIPKGEQKNEVENKIKQAEEQLGIAKTIIAKELGYRLHQCTFPPQIMLSVGEDEEGIEQFKCPKCGNIWPGPEPELPTGMRI